MVHHALAIVTLDMHETESGMYTTMPAELIASDMDPAWAGGVESI
jgi:hypothetical protein